MERQIATMVDECAHRSDRALRVLPVGARIEGDAVPRSAFCVYQYLDPADPVVVAVDTLTTDLILVDPEEVGHHLALYQRLREASLSPTDSIQFLKSAMPMTPSPGPGNWADELPGVGS